MRIQRKNTKKLKIVYNSQNGCNPKDVKDFDGKDNTETHEHDDIEKYVEKCYYLKCKDYVIVVGYI